MKDMMKYKGYYGSAHYSDDDGVFYGKIEFIQSLVSYEGKDVTTLKEAFQEAVEDYLETCKELGREPEKPFTGRIILKVSSDLYKAIALQAEQQQKSIDSWILEACRKSMA